MDVKIFLLHQLARMLRVQFKVGGFPYGAKLTNSDSNHLASQRMSSSKIPNT
jgi:hypothetical protein